MSLDSKLDKKQNTDDIVTAIMGFSFAIFLATYLFISFQGYSAAKEIATLGAIVSYFIFVITALVLTIRKTKSILLIVGGVIVSGCYFAPVVLGYTGISIIGGCIGGAPLLIAYFNGMIEPDYSEIYEDFN